MPSPLAVTGIVLRGRRCVPGRVAAVLDGAQRREQAAIVYSTGAVHEIADELGFLARRNIRDVMDNQHLA